MAPRSSSCAMPPASITPCLQSVLISGRQWSLALWSATVFCALGTMPLFRSQQVTPSTRVPFTETRLLTPPARQRARCTIHGRSHQVAISSPCLPPSLPFSNSSNFPSQVRRQHFQRPRFRRHSSLRHWFEQATTHVQTRLHRHTRVSTPVAFV